MNWYEIVIEPTSPFGTPLKGDTLFGHICWQAHYHPDLLKGGLEQSLAEYDTHPFAVFSSAILKLGDRYVLKRPDMPLAELFDLTDPAVPIKEYKRRKWCLADSALHLDLAGENFQSDSDLAGTVCESLSPDLRRRMDPGKELSPRTPFSRTHNSINRLTLTTGWEGFAPFSREAECFLPETQWAIFALIDESVVDTAHLETALKNIGKWGFGRDATTGGGRFELLSFTPMKDFPYQPPEANGWYTLAPCVPEKGAYRKGYFTAFTRFGKHGDIGAKTGNPFKNPVVMADEGAVLFPNQPDILRNRLYAGRSVRNISAQTPSAVQQGYAPVIPVKI